LGSFLSSVPEDHYDDEDISWGMQEHHWRKAAEKGDGDVLDLPRTTG